MNFFLNLQKFKQALRTHMKIYTLWNLRKNHDLLYLHSCHTAIFENHRIDISSKFSDTERQKHPKFKGSSGKWTAPTWSCSRIIFVWPFWSMRKKIAHHIWMCSVTATYFVQWKKIFLRGSTKMMNIRMKQVKKLRVTFLWMNEWARWLATLSLVPLPT